MPVLFLWIMVQQLTFRAGILARVCLAQQVLDQPEEELMDLFCQKLQQIQRDVESSYEGKAVLLDSSDTPLPDSQRLNIQVIVPVSRLQTRSRDNPRLTANGKTIPSW